MVKKNVCSALSLKFVEDFLFGLMFPFLHYFFPLFLNQFKLERRHCFSICSQGRLATQLLPELKLLASMKKLLITWTDSRQCIPCCPLFLFRRKGSSTACEHAWKVNCIGEDFMIITLAKPYAYASTNTLHNSTSMASLFWIWLAYFSLCAACEGKKDPSLGKAVRPPALYCICTARENGTLFFFRNNLRKCGEIACVEGGD